VIAASLAALCMGATAAHAAPALPAVQHMDGIEVLSGGIGHDEALAMQREAGHWPLALEFAVKDQRHADFAADVAVRIRDAKGHEVLHTTASGPFLLARLPAGLYKIDAGMQGRSLHREVHVQAGQPARALFLWPQGVDHPAL
jgi:hypothetical protein